MSGSIGVDWDDLFQTNINITIPSSSSGGGNSSTATEDREYADGVAQHRESALDDYYNFIQPDTTAAGKTNVRIENHRTAWDYNLNDTLFHSAFSPEDIILLDFQAIQNPYSEKVIISSGYAIEDVYGDNPAYAEFENLVTEIQNKEYEIVYDSLLSSQEDAQSLVNDIYSNYNVDRYGDINDINLYAGDITALESEIYEHTLEDELTKYYDRINDTDNSDLIQEQEDELQELKESLSALTDDYDNKEFQEKLKQLQNETNSESDNWNTDFFWAVDPEGLDLSSFRGVTQDPKSHFILNSTGEMNRWMAGGDLYDAPRAGDVLFNVAGDLNTLRFLGLQDSNPTPDLVKRFVNPDVSSMFGPMAGDENFSVL